MATVLLAADREAEQGDCIVAERETIARVQTCAWNKGMKDGWDNRLSSDGPTELKDPVLVKAWLSTYREAYDEGQRSALPYGD